MKDPSLTLVVEIFLNTQKTSRLLKEDLPAFKDHIYQRIERLLQDLGIPSLITLSITRKKDLDPPVLLLVNGIECRLPYKFRYLQEITPEKLQKGIIDGILLNRKYLITTEHARTIREIWSAKKNQRYLSNLSDREFCDYLQLLIQNGYKIDRGDHLNPFDFPSQPFLAFEQAVKEIKNIQLILYYPNEKRGIKQKSFLKKLQEKIPQMQDILFYELGVRIPLVQLQEEAGLGHKEFSVQINDLRLDRFQGLEEDEILVNAGKADLLKMHLEGKPCIHPIHANICYIVKETGGVKENFHAAGIETWDPLGFLELCLMAIIQKQAGNFLTLEGLEFELDYFNQVMPELILGFKQKYPLDLLIRVLRELLREKISIRDLKGIMEAILGIKNSIKAPFNEKIILIPSQYIPLFSIGEAGSPEQADPALFAESIRVSQKKYISQKFTKGQGTLWVYLLDPGLEKLFLDPNQNLLAGKKSEIHRAIAEEIQNTQNSRPYTVILTSIEIRRPLQALIQVEFPIIEVLSYLEITPEISIQLMGKIALPG